MIKQMSLIILFGFLFISRVFAAAFDTPIPVDLTRNLVSCVPAGSTLTVTENQLNYYLTEAVNPVPVSPVGAEVNNDPELNTSPAGILLLFVGGGGVASPGSANFVARTRHLFVAHGFHVALVDAAADFKSCPGVLKNRRTSGVDSAAYIDDLKKVVNDLRGRYQGVPLFAIGTSRGSTSAAIAGAHNLLNGIVLTSPLTKRRTSDGTTIATVLDVPLRSISENTLIVAHKQDACYTTIWDGAQSVEGYGNNGIYTVRDDLTRSNVDIFLTNEVPIQDVTRPCGALSPHGFFGIEMEVVAEISKWLKHDCRRRFINCRIKPIPVIKANP